MPDQTRPSRARSANIPSQKFRFPFPDPDRRERERVCVCVCVCVRERERESKRPKTTVHYSHLILSQLSTKFVVDPILRLSKPTNAHAITRVVAHTHLQISSPQNDGCTLLTALQSKAQEVVEVLLIFLPIVPSPLSVNCGGQQTARTGQGRARQGTLSSRLRLSQDPVQARLVQCHSTSTTNSPRYGRAVAPSTTYFAGTSS